MTSPHLGCPKAGVPAEDVSNNIEDVHLGVECVHGTQRFMRACTCQRLSAKRKHSIRTLPCTLLQPLIPPVLGCLKRLEAWRTGRFNACGFEQVHWSTEANGYTGAGLSRSENRIVHEIEAALMAPAHKNIMRVYGAVTVRADKAMLYPSPGLECATPHEMVVAMATSMGSFGSLDKLIG